MATQYVSMSNTMRVYKRLRDLRDSGVHEVSRAEVARGLSGDMCRATCYWAFQVLTEAGIIMTTSHSKPQDATTGRPPQLYTLYHPWWPRSITVAELTIENHYIRRGNNGS